MNLKELEREGTRRLKRHRGMRWEAWQMLVQEETNYQSTVEWALAIEPAALQTELYPRTARPPRWAIYTFVRGCMP